MALITEADTVVVFKTVNIDGKATGDTALGTTPNPAPEQFVPWWAFAYDTNVSNVITPPTVAVGSNPANYDNIVPAAALSLASGKIWPLALATNPSFVGQNITINVHVSVAANATNYRFAVVLVGIFLPPD